MKNTKNTFFSRNKFKLIFGTLTVVYLLTCQSCMTMRTSKKEAKSFYNDAKVAFTDSTIAIDEYKIHYMETGLKSNPTLFFVHGSPGSWDAYKDYLKDSLLLKKYRMIAVDRTGFGYSDFGEAQDLDNQAKILENVLDKLKINKNIYLIGHSYGGPLIVKMAVDRPNDYKEIVVLAGAVDPDAEKPELWRLLFKAKPVRYFVPGALRPANDELWWLKEDLIRMKPKLSNIKCDVILVHGTKDDLVPYSNAAFMQKEFVNAKSFELVSIKDANHFIPWTHFDTIRKKLLDLK